MYQTISNYDIMWLAGLIEGEGSFSTTPKGVPRVRIYMADADVISRAMMIIGLPQRRVQMFETPNKTPMYGFEVNGYPALKLMKRLYPHMGSRRQQKIIDIQNATEISYSKKELIS